jgi:hypothetical protein
MASSQPAAALAQDIARTDLVHDLVTQAPSNKGDDATLALMPLKNTADGNSKGDVDKTAVEIEDGTNGEASGDTVAPPVEEPIPPHWKTNVALFFVSLVMWGGVLSGVWDGPRPQLLTVGPKLRCTS